MSHQPEGFEDDFAPYLDAALAGVEQVRRALDDEVSFDVIEVHELESLPYSSNPIPVPNSTLDFWRDGRCFRRMIKFGLNLEVEGEAGLEAFRSFIESVCPAPMINVRTLDDIGVEIPDVSGVPWFLNREAPKLRLARRLFKLKFDGEPDSDVQLFIEQAWSLLAQNTDLLRWAVCWAVHSNELADHLVHAVLGTFPGTFEKRQLKVVAKLGERLGGSAQIVATAIEGSKKITLYRPLTTSIPFRTIPGGRIGLRALLRDRDFGPGYMCGLAGLAATLVHEMVHLYKGIDSDTHTQGDPNTFGTPNRHVCSSAEVIAQLVGYGLTYRYPEFYRSDCTGWITPRSRRTPATLDAGNTTAVFRPFYKGGQ